ncbi:MAG: YggT family protein [Candidatus Hodarchaeota archaeon]
MDKLLSFSLNILILGLFIHWILGFIRSTQYSQVEQIRAFLNKIYNPFLELIRNKIKPLLKISDGKYLDFSPLILFIGLVIIRRLVYLIF